MLRTRVMPCLLMRGRALVKTVRFKDPAYVGDPINTVRIFNEREVDELILLDISATPRGGEPAFETVEEIAAECFMPLAYGGGIRSVDHIRRLFSAGVEKVILNTCVHSNPDLVRKASDAFGSQSIVVSIDYRRKWLGRHDVCVEGGSRKTGVDPVSYACRAEEMGAGEIFLTSIDRDGTMSGYDVETIQSVADAVSIPVVACGGAGSHDDFASAVKAGASAVAAGSLFVYQGANRAVLINYPTPATLESVLAA